MGLLSKLRAKFTKDAAPSAQRRKRIKFSRILRMWVRKNSFLRFGVGRDLTTADRRLLRNARKRERQERRLHA